MRVFDLFICINGNFSSILCINRNVIILMECRFCIIACVRQNFILVLHVINITFLEGCTIVSSMHMFACVNMQYHHTMTVIQYVRCLVRM